MMSAHDDARVPLAELGDRVLVDRATDGDGRAFEVIVRRHGPLMRAYAIRLMSSTAEADDVVQESFITAWQQLHTLTDGSAVKSWLMRIVSRKGVDRLRSRRRYDDIDTVEVAAPETSGPENSAQVRSQMDALKQALARLPEQQRECWVLREVGGLSYDEIAEQLSVPVPTVRGRIARARETLTRELEGWR
jgi:RNA polymerase sigma-70 factor (ECF subfamily)